MSGLQHSARIASASSSSLLMASASEGLTCHSNSGQSLREKGKGRATSPETPIVNRTSSRKGKNKAGGQGAVHSMSNYDEWQQVVTPPDLPRDSTPKVVDSANLSTPTSSMTFDAASFKAPWSFCPELETSQSVSIDLGDPFTFDPFNHQEHPYRAKPASLGLRRRAYQSGATSVSSHVSDEGRLSRIDRATIFSGLRPPTPHSPLVSLGEMMPSSSKRSFEEAISPISSPSSLGRVQGLERNSSKNRVAQQSTSRGYTSSVSSPIDVLRASQGSGSSAGTYNSQSTRRRVPYKRRRGAASSHDSVSEVESYLSSPFASTDHLLHLQEEEREGSPSRLHLFGRSNTTATDASALVTSSTTLQQSLEESSESSFDPVELPSSTTQLLQQWWVDTETPFSGSQADSERSTMAEMGSEQGLVDSQADRNEEPSNTLPASSNLSSYNTVLRRLQLQEREEEERLRSQDGQSQEYGSEYHDQLMDVFRRLNGRSEEVLPRTPLRSTAMHRSTTQMSSTGESRNGSDTLEAANHRAEVGNVNSSYLDTADTSNERISSLPSPIRTTGYGSTLLAMRQARQSSRLSQLPARGLTLSLEQMARRNQEVLERYSSPLTQNRPRHAGSPTFPPTDGNARGETTPQERGRRVEESANTTFHYRPPSSRRPSSIDQELSSHRAQQRSEAVQPLWGEYLLAQGPSFTNRGTQSAASVSSESESPNIEEEQSSAASLYLSRLPSHELTARTRSSPSSASNSVDSTSASMNEEFPSSATSLYLARLSQRRSEGNSTLSGTRRRVGALDSSGRLRGPTRRQNEQWLGIGNEEATQSIESRAAERRRRGETSATLEEQERVMSRYRHMSFPDPESTVGLPQQRGNITLEPPQLPSLRSRSPFELPFATAIETTSSSGRFDEGDDTNWLLRSRQLSRPHLRPLTLSNRAGISSSSSDSPISRRSTRREADATDSTQSNRRSLSSFLLSDGSISLDESVRGVESATSTALQMPSGLRSFMDGIQIDDPTEEYWASLSSRRHQPRSPLARAEERESSNVDEDATAAPSQTTRRLSVHSTSRSLRQRSTSGLHSRRRPTLLDADSSAVDMELPSRDRFGLSALMASANETQAVREGEESSQIARLAMSSSRHASRRPTSRWDRYLDDVGTSLGMRSIMEAQAQEQSSSSSSHASFFALSRLAEGSLASTLRSEIATNPANYVADDEFALRDTYEGLLQLSAQIGDVRPKATPAHVIAKLPTCLYTHWLGGSCDVTNRKEEYEQDLTFNLSSDKGKAKAKEDCNVAHRRSSRDTSCSICLESYSGLDTIMSLPCNHAFHGNCVVDWLKTARSCPCCRGDVCSSEEEKTSHPLRILPELYF